MKRFYDYTIIGAGIIGVNVAHVLKQRCPQARILLLDKEVKAGLHGSGRNSGVLHAGFYYHSDSLKAQLTAKGNEYLRSYITRKNLPLNICGKLVVAKNEEELNGLNILYQRGIANNVKVEEVDEKQAYHLEPLAKTHKRALWSPSTAVSDPTLLLQTQLEDVIKMGVEISFGEEVLDIYLKGRNNEIDKRKNTNTINTMNSTKTTLSSTSTSSISSSSSSSSTRVITKNGKVIETECVINCAGLYADIIGKKMGHGKNLHMLPFKGLYLYCSIPLTRLVYPVPDLTQPFLGVHFTIRNEGGCKIGPTAIPAFWREQYGDSNTNLFTNFKLFEAINIISIETLLFSTQPKLRSLAITELAKYSKLNMIKGASRLVPSATRDTFSMYGKAGIRAQLVDCSSGYIDPTRWKLVMDFLMEGTGNEGGVSVLNAISPAWTCSRPVAELVVDRVLEF